MPRWRPMPRWSLFSKHQCLLFHSWNIVAWNKRHWWLENKDHRGSGVCAAGDDCQHMERSQVKTGDAGWKWRTSCWGMISFFLYQMFVAYLIIKRYKYFFQKKLCVDSIPNPFVNVKRWFQNVSLKFYMQNFRFKEAIYQMYAFFFVFYIVKLIIITS